MYLTQALCFTQPVLTVLPVSLAHFCGDITVQAKCFFMWYTVSHLFNKHSVSHFIELGTQGRRHRNEHNRNVKTPMKLLYQLEKLKRANIQMNTQC